MQKYRKFNKDEVYIHKSSNCSPAVIRNLIPGINKCLSNLLANREIFNRATLYYNDALAKIRITEKLMYGDSPKRMRTIIIWYYSPFNREVFTNVAR